MVMTQRGLVLAVACVMGGFSWSWAASAEPPAEPAPAGAPAGAPAPASRPPARARGGTPAVGAVPATYMLGQDPMQEALKLSDEQKQKIRDLFSNFQRENAADRASLDQVPPEERQARVAELQKAVNQRSQALDSQLEAVLSPEQRQQMQQVIFQINVAQILATPQVLQRIEPSGEQRQKMAEIFGKIQADVFRMQRETGEKLLGVLTDEQRKKLEQMFAPRPAPAPAPAK
jgi:Spy/CpxP family protein refolding chaperone